MRRYAAAFLLSILALGAKDPVDELSARRGALRNAFRTRHEAAVRFERPALLGRSEVARAAVASPVTKRRFGVVATFVKPAAVR